MGAEGLSTQKQTIMADSLIYSGTKPKKELGKIMTVKEILMVIQPELLLDAILSKDCTRISLSESLRQAFTLRIADMLKVITKIEPILQSDDGLIEVKQIDFPQKELIAGSWSEILGRKIRLSSELSEKEKYLIFANLFWTMAGDSIGLDISCCADS